MRQVIAVARRAYHGVPQLRVGIHADIGLHVEVPLVALLGLEHLGVALTAAILD